MIFYFSGTGNSRGVAQLLAERLNDRAVDIIGSDPASFTFTEADRVGFAFPIYGYVAPKVMLDFAAKMKTNGAYTFAIPTFSNKAGCTLEHFSQTACHLDGGFGIKMPDNMPVFNKIVETRETAIGKLERAIPRFEEVAQKVASRVREFDILYGDDAEKNTWEVGVRFLQPDYNGFPTKAYHVLENLCVGCGVCADVCPAGIIKLENDVPVWTQEKCHICMACLNNCPTEAIQYGQYSEGKYRYLFRGFDLSKY